MSEQNNRDHRGGDQDRAPRSNSSQGYGNAPRRDSQGRPETNDRKAPKRWEDRKPSSSRGSDRPSRDGERKSFSDRGDRKPFTPRDGERKPFADRGDRPERKSFSDRGERKPFGDRPSRDGDRKPFTPRDGERKPFADRGDRPERKSFSDRGERKPFGDRPSRDGDRKPFTPRDGERKPFADRGERKPFADRPSRDGERRSFNDRSDRGDRKPFGDRPSRDGDRKPFTPRDGERKPFSDRGDRKPFTPRDGERKPFADRGDRPERKSFSDRGERKPFGDRPSRDGDRKPFTPRDGERKPFADRGDRKPFSDRGARPERKSFSDRGERKPFGDRPSRDGERRSFGTDDAAPVARPHNARDLRSANRPDRERSPEIDEDVTGQELDKVTRAQLRNLEEVSGEWVSKHLVMAGRLIDDEPELAFQHALAASRRGGRMAAVREAVGLTAYAAGHFAEALREFRTFRRISGSNAYLAMMADCERGLGRPDRALDMARSEEAKELDTAGQVDMAIVTSGARMDMEQYDAAVTALEIPQLDRNRAFSYSPRLFRAYADALEVAGRAEDAEVWRNQALRAESALGVGAFAEPEILDLVGDDEEERPDRAPRHRAEGSADGEPAENEHAPRHVESIETSDGSAELELGDDIDALPSDEEENVLGSDDVNPDEVAEDAAADSLADLHSGEDANAEFAADEEGTRRD